MKRITCYRRALITVLIFNLLAIAFLYFKQVDDQFPDQLLVFENGAVEFNYNLPVSGEWEEKEVKVFNNQKKLNFREPVRMQLKHQGNYKINLKLFGLIRWKNMEIKVVEEKQVIPGGVPVGIYVKTDGLLVLGTGRVTGADGFYYEPALNIVKTGDYIETFNGNSLGSIKEFQELIENAEEKEVLLGIRRNGEKMEVKLTAVKGNTGEHKLGIWVRQDTQGIGTLTYYTEEGEFGALGHGITDADTGELVEMKEGKVYEANIVNIMKGKQGQPGELVGYINRSEPAVLGELENNTTCGIFGTQMELENEREYGKPIEIALKQEVKPGKAFLLCQMDGEVQKYEIEIKKLRYNLENLNKGMVIEITDPDLLEKTNGIVQGMSGSPILQNGKIVGAVTHVLVNDPTRGYGIFIENMLEH